MSSNKSKNSRVPTAPTRQPKDEKQALRLIKEELKTKPEMKIVPKHQSLGPRGVGFSSKVEYYGLLSPPVRAWLAALVDPFAGLKSARGGSSYAQAPSIPVLPPAKARRYCCFARGTFNTIPQNGTLSGAIPYRIATDGTLPVDTNLGWIAISPKLFGLDMQDSEYDVPTSDIPSGQNFTKRLVSNQPPVLFTKGSAQAGYGTPISPQYLGQYAPVQTFPTPGVSGTGIDFVKTTSGGPGSYLLATNTMNCVQVGFSNSDVPWWTVLPKSNPQSVDTADLSLQVVSPTGDGVTAVGAWDYQFDPTESYGGARFRCVSVGVRIRYMGTEINRGGQIVGLRSPTGDTLVGGAYGGVGVMLESTNLEEGYYDIPPFKANFTVTSPDVVNSTLTPATASPFFGATPQVGFTFDRLLGFDECTTKEVTREWSSLVYLPVDETSLHFQHLYDGATLRTDDGLTGTFTDMQDGSPTRVGRPISSPSVLMDNDWGYSMLIMVRGPDATTVANFEYEVVGHYEVVGEDIRGRVPTPCPDPSGVAAVMATPRSDLQTHVNPIAAHVAVVQSATQQSFIHPTVRTAAMNPPKGVLAAMKSVAEGVGDAVETAQGMAETATEVMDYIGNIASMFL